MTEKFMQNLDEVEIVRRAKADPQAFGVLYDRYVDRIYVYAQRLVQDGELAQDITAVTFEKALRHIRTYQWQGKSFAAWLYRIARNEAMSHHRKSWRWLPWHSAETYQNGHHQQREMETAVSTHQTHQTLHQALAKLSPKDREIVSLRYFDSFSNDEIAEIVGCSTSNVYVRLHRALKRLQKQIEQLDPQGLVHYVS